MKDKLSSRFWARWLLAAFFVLFLFNGVLEARAVAYSEAWLSSARLLEMENGRPDLRLTKGTFWLDSIEPLSYQDQPVAYLVKLKPQGFMILSDITEVSPQVFISFSGDYETASAHPFLIRILDHLKYNKVHLRYYAGQESPGGQPQPEESPDVFQMGRNERAWSALVGGSFPAIALYAEPPSSAAAGPLLNTHWKQDRPYNNYTPLIGDLPTYTGCSATAMAQVMNFWKCPDLGQGSHSYIWHGQTLSADFDHSYYWDRMLDTYSGNFTSLQSDAVARLMSDVGIAINMRYELGGSGAYVNDNNAFVNFFKYGPDVHSIRRASVADWTAWFDILKQQMDMRQPAILSIWMPEGGGHAVVADGYRTSPSNQIHINMGWGENYDDYFNIDNIYGYGDANSDSAVIDIHPAKLKLTIQAGAGGTTDPAPGVYEYDYGIVVRVTALPDLHFRFLEWTGDWSGTENPTDIRIDNNRSVTANFQRIIYAPSNAAGQKVVNRSLSQAEYINVITFEPNPDNVDIVKYTIYSVVGWQRTELVTLDRNTFKYLHRGVAKDKTYTYQVVAVNNFSREGDPAVVIIQ
jgi:hypothetical protein